MRLSLFSVVVVVASVALVAGCPTQGQSQAAQLNAVFNTPACQDGLDRAEFEASVVMLETLRDGGISKLEALDAFLGACGDLEQARVNNCRICITNMIDVVWG